MSSARYDFVLSMLISKREGRKLLTKISQLGKCSFAEDFFTKSHIVYGSGAVFATHFLCNSRLGPIS
jgi:hypothetical protein